MAHPGGGKVAQLTVRRGGYTSHERDTQSHALQHIGTPRCGGSGDRNCTQLDTARVSSFKRTPRHRGGGKLKAPLDPWNVKSHDREYEGSFVEFLEPGQEPRLIEVSSSQADYETGGSLLHWWAYVSTKGIGVKRILTTGSIGKRWGNPAVICLEIKPNRQAHVHRAKVTKGTLGDTDKCGTGLMGGSQR